MALGFVVAMLGASIGYLGKPDSPATRFINFDAESVPPGGLVGVWGGFEQMPSGDTFVWCASSSCAVQIQVERNDDRIVRVRLWPFLYPGAPTQTVTVVVNGTPVGTKPLANVASVVSFPASRSVWRKGSNEVRFQFAYAETPKSKFPESEDIRRLAAGFDWVEIATPAPPAK